MGHKHDLPPLIDEFMFQAFENSTQFYDKAGK
jgi:hypothetical protein